MLFLYPNLVETQTSHHDVISLAENRANCISFIVITNRQQQSCFRSSVEKKNSSTEQHYWLKSSGHFFIQSAVAIVSCAFVPATCNWFPVSSVPLVIDGGKRHLIENRFYHVNK